ncbi:MFS transporter [Neobacillus vireti]|uniref:MFS transporter n=2 Tax=Neobacillus vireti TaxID=220686 RepID=UPI0006494E6B|nr:MFS transporter [Neobacillus vireti]KLT19948.1 MFS transporter [Neobacillus vireti]
MLKKIHYGWVILAVCFIGVLAAQGLRYCFGAFMEPWEQEFTASRSMVSAISFVSFIVFALSQPVIGKLIDKHGVKRIFVYSIILIGVTTILIYFAQNIWQLLILYGVISSLGFGGASGVTATIAVTKWFHKKQGLALGLVEAGFGAGQMVMVSSSLFLINAFGWKSTVLLLGGFLLLIVFPLLAIFLKSEPAEMGIKALGAVGTAEKQQQDSMETKETQPILKKGFLFHRGFWFLIIPFFICGFTTTGLMDTHLIPFAQACGFSVAVTGTAVSLLAAFNTGGTVVAGILADRFDNRKMIAWIYFFRGMTIVFLVIFLTSAKWLGFFIENPWLLFVFSISFGIVDFAVVAPTVKLLADYFRGSSLGVVTGFLYMSHQLGSAIGSFLPGVFFDRAGSYTSSLVTAAILLMLAAIVSACLPKQTAHQEAKAA